MTATHQYDAEFFYQHAHWNEVPDDPAQSERVRLENAQELAEVYRANFLEVEEVSAQWTHDEDADSTLFSDDGDPYPLWVCTVWKNGEVLTWSGLIDLGRDVDPASAPCARVCEAELIRDPYATA